ncbi:hypothetical protein ACNKHR_25575 [Shigella flexneri]
MLSPKRNPAIENKQDISALVGKVDIRKLEHCADDPDAYGYSVRCAAPIGDHGIWLRC